MARPNKVGNTPVVSFAFTLLLLLLFSSFAHGQSTVTGTAWLSGPTSIWSAILTGGGSTLATNALKTDFQNAIAASDSGAAVTIDSLAANTAPASGPAYGANVAYTVATTTLSQTDIDDCLRAATLTQVNSIIAAAISTAPLKLTITVLHAKASTDVTKIVDALLPLTGATYMWQVVLKTLATEGVYATAGFVVPVQGDLQNAIDAAAASYLVVVPLDTTKSVVNASSLYVSYSVWSFPANTAPATSAQLQKTAMAASFPLLNAFVADLQTAYTALAAYADLFPKAITTWTPLVLDVVASSSSSTAIVETVDNVAGDYLLTFAGVTGTWWNVWSASPTALSATIVAAAEVALAHGKFVTQVGVLAVFTEPNDPKYVGGLRVLCHISRGATLKTSKYWEPEEIASMLLQGDYTATRTLYLAGAAAAALTDEKLAIAGDAAYATAPLFRPSQVQALAATTAGSLATTGIDYNYNTPMTKYEIGIIIMAAVIGFFIVLAFLIACCCCCCCRRCVREKDPRQAPPGWEADVDEYNRNVQNQDRAFEDQENPRAAQKQPLLSPIGAREGCPTPNPLLTPPEDDSCYSPREAAQKQRYSTPETAALSAEKTPQPMEMAHGVPLEPLATPPEKDRKNKHHHRSHRDRSPATEPREMMEVNHHAVASAPPAEDDPRGGGVIVASTSTQKHQRSHSLENDNTAMHGYQSEDPAPAASGTTQSPRYLANVMPTAFFDGSRSNGAAAGNDASDDQMRLSQGSDPLLAGHRTSNNEGADTALPPPVYPDYDARGGAAMPMAQFSAPHPPPAYPMRESPTYSPLHHNAAASAPPGAASAYPSPDLYANAPAPGVSTSLGSFIPMPAIKRPESSG